MLYLMEFTFCVDQGVQRIRWNAKGRMLGGECSVSWERFQVGKPSPLQRIPLIQRGSPDTRIHGQGSVLTNAETCV